MLKVESNKIPDFYHSTLLIEIQNDEDLRTRLKLTNSNAIHFHNDTLKFTFQTSLVKKIIKFNNRKSFYSKLRL
jgi:hypothetical protein